MSARAAKTIRVYADNEPGAISEGRFEDVPDSDEVRGTLYHHEFPWPHAPHFVWRSPGVSWRCSGERRKASRRKADQR